MTVFDDDAASILAAEFGETVTLKPQVGDEVTLNATVGRLGASEAETEDGYQHEEEVEIRVAVSAATPLIEDFVTVGDDSKTYHITDVNGPHEGIWAITARRVITKQTIEPEGRKS